MENETNDLSHHGDTNDIDDSNDENYKNNTSFEEIEENENTYSNKKIVNTTDNKKNYKNENMESDSCEETNQEIPSKKNDQDKSKESKPEDMKSNTEKSKYSEYYKKILLKQLFKKLAMILHPDKSDKYKDGALFKKMSDSYNNKEISALIYFAVITKLNISFIDYNSLLNILLKELRIVIEIIR